MDQVKDKTKLKELDHWCKKCGKKEDKQTNKKWKPERIAPHVKTTS